MIDLPDSIKGKSSLFLQVSHSFAQVVTIFNDFWLMEFLVSDDFVLSNPSISMMASYKKL
jgi:hypothetical protein